MVRHLFAPVTALFLSLLSACSGTGTLNALAPSSLVTVRNDVAYGASDRQKLDIYTPAESVPGRGPEGRPLVVFLYGGGWRDGGRGMYPFAGKALAAQGIITVIPDYRVYPEVRFPVFVQDAAQALAWAVANARELGGDPRRVFVMGHSAGGHIAALLTLDPSYLTAEGLDPDRVLAGMIGLAGPYDFLPLTDPIYKTIFATAPDLRVTQPITYARAGAPPLLLLNGRADTTVLPRNAERLAARVRVLGGQAQDKYYPGIGHSLLLGALSGPLTFLAPVKDDVTRFIGVGAETR